MAKAHKRRKLKPSQHPRLLRYARKARKAGVPAGKAWVIATEAYYAGIPLSLAFALGRQESNFAGIYGHDPVANRAPKGGKVTRRNYGGVYLPDRRRGLGMQGVREFQLTWWQTQDRADALGGCDRLRPNARVAFETLAANIRAFGLFEGCARYNGTGPAAQAYARSLLALAHWYKGQLT